MSVRKRILSAGRTVRDTFLYGPREKTHLRWQKVKGDITHRIDYDFLNENSIVFDCGGYRGQWASDIYAKYGSTVYVFEPVKEYADFIRKRFYKNSKIKVFEFGLSDKSEEKLINVSEEGSSTYLKGANCPVRMEDFITFINRENIKEIDLLKLNIEGGEYDLLPYLLKTDYIKHIRALQVQFHDFFKEAKSRMIDLMDKIAETHSRDYSYEFTWEGWSRR